MNAFFLGLILMTLNYIFIHLILQPESMKIIEHDFEIRDLRSKLRLHEAAIQILRQEAARKRLRNSIQKKRLLGSRCRTKTAQAIKDETERMSKK